jgi:hypothetical protein
VTRRKAATPAAVPAAALVTPVRALATAFTIESEYLTRVLGKRSTEEIKDIGQCLIEAHRLAVEAGVRGLTLPEGGVLISRGGRRGGNHQGTGRRA